jgi:SAM-dependent methyltransferase
MDRHGWDERYRARPQTFPAGPNRLVVEEVEPLPPGLAFDLATGEGRHAVWLAALGWHVVAADVSGVGLGKAVARARQEGVAVAFAQADVHRLRFPPARFDLVLASFFHARPPDRAPFYETVAQSLVPSGMFLIVGYDQANLTEGTGGPQDPELLLRPELLAAELEAAGLTVERADTVRLRTTTIDGDEVDVVDALIKAVRPARRGLGAPG